MGDCAALARTCSRPLPALTCIVTAEGVAQSSIVRFCSGTERCAVVCGWRGVVSQVSFAVREYALVFRRATGEGRNRTRPAWSVVRPRYRQSRRAPGRWQPAELLVVPVCSALALDTPSYEAFLRSSGVLDDALDLLGPIALADTATVETARRRIHSLVMAAEVQHIVDRLSA